MCAKSHAYHPYNYTQGTVISSNALKPVINGERDFWPRSKIMVIDCWPLTASITTSSSVLMYYFSRSNFNSRLKKKKKIKHLFKSLIENMYLSPLVLYRYDFFFFRVNNYPQKTSPTFARLKTMEAEIVHKGEKKKKNLERIHGV